MILSIIIPVYNEKNNILKIIEKVINVKIDKEIIIIDDGSTDGTREILKKLKIDNASVSVSTETHKELKTKLSTPTNEYRDEQNISMLENEKLKIIFHEKNLGKGFAIRTGIKEVKGDIILIQDADLEYDPNEYYKLIEPILQGKTEVVYGSRVLKKNPKASLIFYLGGRFLSFVTNFLYGTKITDEPTCYKVFSTKLLKSINLECKRFEFCPEVTAKIAKKGYAIFEVPISYNPRSVKEGKKINWRDGVEAVWTLIKYKFKD